MLLKAFHPRPMRWPSRIRIRGNSSLRPGEVAPPTRLYSLLLPPRYPADRR